MFTHVRVGCSDVDKARAFYDAVLGTLGIAPGSDMYGMVMYSDGANRFAVAPPREGSATYANGGTIGFVAPSAEAVDAFHEAGVANGGASEGEPGARGGGSMYAAYLRDPDGNKIVAIKQG